MNLLHDIQQELKVPKENTNTYANYKYRSAEDILEMVKPLLFGKGNLTINDEIVNIGTGNYVKATVTLVQFPYDETEGNTVKFSHSGQSWSATAYAREPEEQKGLSAAQITGATSSYARKYALNALFAIDDTKDADSMDNGSETPKKGRETGSKDMTTSRPWLDEEKYNAMLDALDKGEKETVKKAMSKYQIKAEYLSELNKRLK